MLYNLQISFQSATPSLKLNLYTTLKPGNFSKHIPFRHTFAGIMQFSEVIGHSGLKKQLIQTVKEGRIPHARLFYGPEGNGKLALGLAYSTYLSCANKQAEDSCGSCPSCLKFAKLAHPDLHFIFPVATNATIREKPRSIDFLEEWRQYLLARHAYVSLNDWYEQIGIEKKQGIINANDCNEIVRTLGYTSYEGNYKFMVIWMVEKLYHAAAPKILKILEEPPDKTVFLLISENTDLIIPTILSRTQLLKVPPIDQEAMVSHLQTIEQAGTSDLQKIASLSGGNYIEALKYLEDAADETLTFTHFRNWMLASYLYKVSEIQTINAELAKLPKESLKAFLIYGIRVIRYCLHLNTPGHPEIVLRGKELEFVRNFSKYVTVSNAEALFGLFNEAIFHIERNAYVPLVLMDVSLRAGKLLQSARS